MHSGITDTIKRRNKMFATNASLIGKYQNGNYMVYIFEDGTKIRANNLDHFEAAFSENIDLKITNYCDKQSLCEFCHENSTANGKHGDILNNPLLQTLHPYTELAIGGGNPLMHPDFDAFLKMMSQRHIICNVTVNEDQWDDILLYYRDKGLIHGIGVSITTWPADDTLRRLTYKNVVAHVIAGIAVKDMLKELAIVRPKLLVPGYKQVGHGKNFILDGNAQGVLERINECEEYIRTNKSKFKLVSFDNLALEQLHVRDWIDDDTWETCYMGDDGEHTMYIDAVNNMFGVSSASERKPIPPCVKKIDELFYLARRDT